MALWGILGGALLLAGVVSASAQSGSEAVPQEGEAAPKAKKVTPPKEEKDRIEVQVKLDKSEYRPGEMMVCQVELVNRYDTPMLVAQPVSVKQVRHSNLHFRLLRKGSEQMYRRTPVVIKEPALVGDMLAPQFESLQPGAGLLEKYAFVNLTRAEGEYVLYVEYESVTARDKGDGGAATAKKGTQKSGVSVEFAVKGPRLWQRDSNDLLTREEAIRVAKAKYGREVAGARATLVETQSSLLDWWVTLDRNAGDTPAGENARVGYYVSPYGGFVRAQAPTLAVEPEQALKTLMDERTRKFREMQTERKSSPLKSLGPPTQPGVENSGAPDPNAAALEVDPAALEPPVPAGAPVSGAGGSK
jgi:hypothetical protein